MEILSVIETMEEIIETASGVPFINKCLVDREEMFELIKELRIRLPDDIKQAQWIKQERQKIMADAEKEAELILKDAENRIMSLVDNHEITKQAYEQSNDIVSSAQKNAREIRLGTKEYADGILCRVEGILSETIDVIKVNRNAEIMQ